MCFSQVEQNFLSFSYLTKQMILWNLDLKTYLDTNNLIFCRLKVDPVIGQGNLIDISNKGENETLIHVIDIRWATVIDLGKPFV